MPTSNTSELNFKQPAALWWLALIFSLFEWSYAANVSAITLFMYEDMHSASSVAYGIFGVFASLIWTLPMIGGYLSGKFGHQYATGVGLFFCAVGTAMPALGHVNPIFIYLGLAAFAVGNGFSTPALWCLVDHAYSKNDP